MTKFTSPCNCNTLLQSVVAWLVDKQREQEKISEEDLQADRKALKERLQSERRSEKLAP